jgi:hypothetical protein
VTAEDSDVECHGDEHAGRKRPSQERSPAGPLLS